MATTHKQNGGRTDRREPASQRVDTWVAEDTSSSGRAEANEDAKRIFEQRNARYMRSQAAKQGARTRTKNAAETAEAQAPRETAEVSPEETQASSKPTARKRAATTDKPEPAAEEK
jgi:hypothetical protein